MSCKGRCFCISTHHSSYLHNDFLGAFIISRMFTSLFMCGLYCVFFRGVPDALLTVLACLGWGDRDGMGSNKSDLRGEKS